MDRRTRYHYEKYGQRLLALGERVQFGRHVRLLNPEQIQIGDDVRLLDYTVLATCTSYAGQTFSPRMILGNRVATGAQTRIACAFRVVIEDDVMMSAFTHITDHSHGYEDPTRPIRDQPITSNGAVIIKRGAWLGFAAQVLSGVTVGENAVVGANAVVTHDIPPFSVAVGNPARVIRQFRPGQGWVTL